VSRPKGSIGVREVTGTGDLDLASRRNEWFTVVIPGSPHVPAWWVDDEGRFWQLAALGLAPQEVRDAAEAELRRLIELDIAVDTVRRAQAAEEDA
jgi:hypothetical protein